jgi:hypothetical protein
MGSALYKTNNHNVALFFKFLIFNVVNSNRKNTKSTKNKKNGLLMGKKVCLPILYRTTEE